jgi:superfamily II DNA or RNA helicase
MKTLEKSLKDLILGIKDQIESRVENLFTPAFVPGEDFHKEVFGVTRSLPRKPYLAQIAVIGALVKGFRKHRALALVGEMGVGKTCLSILTAHLFAKRPMRTLVVCPSTLVSTWAEEIRTTLGDKVKVIDANGLGCLAQLIRLRAEPMVPEKAEFWIIGLNRIKTNAPWVSKVIDHPRRGTSCPDCGKSLEIMPDEVRGYDGSWAILKRRTLCPHCGTPLWSYQYDRRIYAPVNFIKARLKRHFGLFIADEAHQFKGGDTIQGSVLGQLGEALPKTLILTGTLSGGKASDVFYLLQRAYALNFGRAGRAEYLPDYSEIKTFVAKYGTLEKTYRKKERDALTGRAGKETCSVRELPGISPTLLGKFLEFTAFLRISDISDALPGYTEILEFVEMPDELFEVYRDFSAEVRFQAKYAKQKGDMKVLGQMLAALMSWPDMPERPIAVVNKEGQVVAEAPAMNIGRNTPKDDRLIECVQEANDRGRKCLIFAEYTGFGALEYLEKRLNDAGLRVLVMKPSVPTYKRLEWIRSKIATGSYDNLLCHPRLVELGLNLREFPSIFFWETGFSTFVLRQASRRSWRPGQKEDVEVRFFITRNTFQENAMCHIARKFEAALLLEGELSDKGLVALSDSDGIGDLARQLVGATTAGQNLEQVFASYRALEKQALASASGINVDFSQVAAKAGEHAGGTDFSPDILDDEVPSPKVVALASKSMAKQPVVVRAPVRDMKLLGELFPKGPNTYLGKVKRREFGIYADCLIFGNEKFPLDGNLELAPGIGRALDYILVERPGLLGSSYMVYGAA